MADKKDTKQEETIEYPSSRMIDVYSGMGTVVARIKTADITHGGANSRAPVIAKVVFGEIVKGTPNLVSEFMIKDPDGQEFTLQFIGEPPKDSIFDLSGTNDYNPNNYPIEIDKEYEVFVRAKRIPVLTDFRDRMLKGE